MNIRELQAYIGNLRKFSTVCPEKILIINTSSIQHFHAAMEIMESVFPEARISVFSNSDLDEMRRDTRIHSLYSSRGHVEEGREDHARGLLFRLRKAKYNLVFVLKSYTGGLRSKIVRLWTQAFALAVGAEIIIVSERQGGVARLSLSRIVLKAIGNILFPIIYIFQVPLNFILSGLFAIVFLFAIIILFLQTRLRSLLRV